MPLNELREEDPLWPNDVPSVWPAPMCPVNPRLPLTVREVPPSEELPERPNDELLEPNREPLIEVLEPKREPEVEELPK